MSGVGVMSQVHLPDSWLLDVRSTDSSVCFILDAALLEGHPLYYWPPKAGEQHPYAQLCWCLVGAVHWNDGPHLDRLADHASGVKDFGHIDVWLESGTAEMLEGDWGCVVVDRATHSVEPLG